VPIIISVASKLIPNGCIVYKFDNADYRDGINALLMLRSRFAILAIVLSAHGKIHKQQFCAQRGIGYSEVEIIRHINQVLSSRKLATCIATLQHSNDMQASYYDIISHTYRLEWGLSRNLAAICQLLAAYEPAFIEDFR
jgi:hypothetical protein